MKSEFLLLFPEINDMPAAEQDALHEYYLSVKLLSEKSWNLEFNNRDMLHGAIVMSQIFITAKSNINIFAGDFNGDICGKTMYQHSLKKAVQDNDVKVKIVFEEMPREESPGLKLIKSLLATNPENIQIKILNDDFKKPGNNEALNHFTIADDLIFRYEIDKKNYKAFCNFDDKKLAEKLKANFEILEYNSQFVKI